MFNPSVAGVGTHTVTYTFTDVNGCTGTATDQITVTTCTTGFEDLNPETINVEVYPNPFATEFTIVSDQTGILEVVMYNSLGENIHNWNVTSNSKLTILDLTPGVYYLRIRNENNFTIKKVVKN
jgi:hypothetical protein